MNTLSYKTVSANKETAKKEWVVLEATDQVLGRLSSVAAKILRGKKQPEFTPHVETGDNVIVYQPPFHIRLSSQFLLRSVILSTTCLSGFT